MRTSFETVSDVELKVNVELPAASVDAEFARQLKGVRKQARIKGFRPGKAPANMVKRLYADYLASETARALISETVGKALEEVPRQVLGDPAFAPATAAEGQPLNYTIHLQVKPELTIADWDAMEIAVAPAVIEDGAVDARITQTREQHKEQVPVEDRGADTGDVLKCQCDGSIDGEPDPRMHVDELPVTLGSTELIPGFTDELMGGKAGEERTFDLTFPEDYFAEDLAGKVATFTVKINEHFVEELPELDDDFAKDAGHDSMEAFRESVTTELQATADKQRDRDIEDRLIALLLERNTFQAPPVMIQSQMEFQARQMFQMFQMQGLPPDKARSILESSRESMAADASRVVQRYLALEALAKQESLDADDAAIDAEIAERTKDAPDHVKEQYATDDVRRSVKLELVERAALDLIKERAIITDAEPSDATDADDAATDADDANTTDEESSE
ncbi:MAG: trigger factor [Myxococcota bacterium]